MLSIVAATPGALPTWYLANRVHAHTRLRINDYCHHLPFANMIELSRAVLYHGKALIFFLAGYGTARAAQRRHGRSENQGHR